jgi:uncharacterized membrane protein
VPPKGAKARAPQRPAAVASGPATPATSGWVVWTSLGLCVLGLLDAAYLTFEHFTASSTLACSDSGTINCLKVTTSSYSKVLGIPVALLGLIFFVAMTVLCLPQVWRWRNPVIRPVRLAATVVGMISVLYLLWAELFKIDAICLFCTGVHVLTFLLFALVATEASGALAPIEDV